MWYLLNLAVIFRHEILSINIEKQNLNYIPIYLQIIIANQRKNTDTTIG